MATDFDMTKPDETVRFFVIRDVATFSIRIFRENRIGIPSDKGSPTLQLHKDSPKNAQVQEVV
jgi:hypothetical protein